MLIEETLSASWVIRGGVKPASSNEGLRYASKPIGVRFAPRIYLGQRNAIGESRPRREKISARSSRDVGGCTVEVKSRKWVNVEWARIKFRGKCYVRSTMPGATDSSGALGYVLFLFLSLVNVQHVYTRTARVQTGGSISRSYPSDENAKGERESTGGGLTDFALVCLVLFFRRTQAWLFVPFLSCPPWTLPRTRALACECVHARRTIRRRKRRECICLRLLLFFLSPR